MAKSKAIYVGCFCGWRGRRVPGECACYDEYASYCNCTLGTCPKCGHRVYTAEYIREIKREDEKMQRMEEDGAMDQILAECCSNLKKEDNLK